MPDPFDDSGMRAPYDELRRDARAGFARGRFETDPRIDDPSDTRRGLSLILRPGPPALAGLAELGDAPREVAGGQYFHAPAELHVTVLSVVSCTDGFRIDEAEPGRYAELLAACVADLDPFELTFEGITASPSCVTVQGFVAGDTLRVSRERLREAITGSGLRHSMERRYTARTAHVTSMRLRRPPRSSIGSTRFGTCGSAAARSTRSSSCSTTGTTGVTTSSTSHVPGWADRASRRRDCRDGSA